MLAISYLLINYSAFLTKQKSTYMYVQPCDLQKTSSALKVDVNPIIMGDI